MRHSLCLSRPASGHIALSIKYIVSHFVVRVNTFVIFLLVARHMCPTLI